MVREEERLFAENVMIGVYTGRLFHASRPGFEGFDIPIHFEAASMFVPRHSIAIKNAFLY